MLAASKMVRPGSRAEQSLSRLLRGSAPCSVSTSVRLPIPTQQGSLFVLLLSFSGQSPTPIGTKTHETKLRVLKCFVLSIIKRSAIIDTSDLGKELQEKSAEAAPAVTVLSASKRGEKL